MKKLLIVGSVVSAFCLTGCATPVTTLKNKKTGEIARCGGGYAASLVGGVAGYDFQRQNDGDCVAKYIALGYEPI